MPDVNRAGDELRALFDSGERRLALLLEHSQRLMAERDPAVLLRHVAAAAREITEAAIAGVGVLNDDGRFADLVSIGLDDAVVAALKEQLTAETDHPSSSFPATPITRCSTRRSSSAISRFSKSRSPRKGSSRRYETY